MISGSCYNCGEDKSDLKLVTMGSGRDYPGVGGSITPPDKVQVCGDCREPVEREDIDCVVCGGPMEGHHPDDPPCHSGKCEDIFFGRGSVAHPGP